MKTWYNMKVIPHQNATSEAEITIFDEIGWFGIDAKQFNEDFAKIKDLSKIKLRINSPGGSVFDGIAIYNMLSTVREKLTVEVEGLAASIASVIAMAGGKIVMREGTFLMVHNPWTMMVGDADDMRKQADVLDKIKDQLITIYTGRTGKTPEEIEALMKEETWLTPTEAKAMGFADEVVESSRIAASYNKPLTDYGFNHTPYSEIKNFAFVITDNVVINEVVEDKKLNDAEQKLKAKILKFRVEQKLKTKDKW